VEFLLSVTGLARNFRIPRRKLLRKYGIPPWLRRSWRSVRRRHPAASPATTRAALIRSGRFDWNDEDDPDAETEPLLNVARF
jgi:hypothetical protein